MRRMIPNLVSASRLALVVPLAMMLWAGRHSEPWRWAVVALFAWMACSDWLDGLLARRLDAQTDLGRVLDPVADKIVALVSFVILAGAGLEGAYYELPLWLVAVVVGKDLWTSVGYLVARMMGVRITVRPSRWGKASTALQLCLVGAILIGPELSRLRLARLLDLLVWSVGAMTAAAAANYTWIAIRRLAMVQVVGPSQTVARA